MNDTRKNIRNLIAKENILGYKGSTTTVYLKFCPVCGSLFSANRMDKLSCGVNCKQRLSRLLRDGRAPVFNKDTIIVSRKALTKAGFRPEHLPVSVRKRYEIKLDQ